MPSNKLLKAFETKQTRFRSSWLKNATRSVGISMGAALEQVAPNTTEVVKSSTEVARAVTMSLTRGRTGINKLNSSLADNSYAKIGRTAIQNALESLKTGKFGDGGNLGMMDLGGGADGGFSYGDDDTDSSSDLSLSGLSSLSDQINRQSIAQIKTAQANMDTMISINSARMYQTQQISGEILSHITNIENSLASMVQFNNETMLKFVQASLGYYDRTGAAIASDKKEIDFSLPERTRSSNVFNNRRGGISMSRYKEYVKKNFQDKIESMGIPLDESALQLLASDPIGFASQFAAQSLLEKFAGGAIKGIEDRLTSAIPNALMSLTKLSDSSNPILKFMGDIFGLRSEKKSGNFKDVKIAKGPIPFDGETKHAITSIITHELRNQTGYLKVIADHVIGGDADSAMKNAREFYNDRTGRFERGLDIDLNIAKDIEEAVVSAFKNTGFGSDLSSFTAGINNDENRKEVERMIDDMYMEVLNQEKDNLSVDDLMTIINNMNDAPKEAKNLLKGKIRAMATKNKTKFMSLGIGKVNARESYNDTFKSIRENRGFNYLSESGFMGLEGKDLDKYLMDTLNRGKGAHVGTFTSSEIQAIQTLVDNQEPDYFAQLAAEGKLNGILAKFDNISSADVDEVMKNLSQKGNKAEIAYRKFKQKIKNSTEYKSIKSTASGLGASAASGAKSAALSAKTYATNKATEIGGSLANLGSHLIGGLQTKTGMISRFIFGDQQKGTNGLFDGIAKSFNDGLKQANPDLEMSDGKKAVMMGGIGALTGSALAHLGFLPAILAGTGPIGGAIAGLTLAIAGAGPMFKRALFGGDVEEFEDDKGNKYTHRKKGLVGRIGTTIEANLINPVKTAAINAISKTALNIEHGILIPFKYLAEFAGKRIGKTVGKTFDFFSKLAGSLTSENGLLNKITGGLFRKGTKAIGGAISGGLNFAASAGGALMNLPGNVFGGLLRFLDPEMADEFDTERAGFRANKRALKQLNKTNKRHDQIGQELAKLTKGEYGEDTEEARAYLKHINPEAYERLFGEKGKHKDFASKDAFKGTSLNQQSGSDITGNPSKYDPQSQAAIYAARNLMMQEQLIRAILGEKVEFGVDKNANIVSAKHEKQMSKEEYKALKSAQRKEKTIKNLYDKLDNEDITPEERAEIVEQLKRLDPDNADSKIKDADFYAKMRGEKNFDQREYRSAMQGGIFSRLFGSLRYSFATNKRHKAIDRYEYGKLGLRYPGQVDAGYLGQTADGGNGFGGFGSDDENRFRAKIASDKAREGRLAAIERGKNIAEFKEEKEKKEDKDWKAKILKAVEGVKTETKEQKDNWSSIFSKKGLITAALILGAPLLLKVIPKVFRWFSENGDALLNGIGTIASTAASILAGLGRIFPDMTDGGDLTNGNNVVENAEEIASRGYANLLPMRNGNIDNTSSAKLNVGANLVRIGMHADDYAKLSKQTVKFAKFRPIANFAAKNNNANRAVGKVITGVKNAPKNIKNLAGKVFNKGNVAKAVTEYGDDVADSAVDLMFKAQQEGLENVAKESAKGAVKGAANGGGLLNKIKGFIGKFYDDVLKKFTEKFGSGVVSLKAFAKEKLIDFLQKHFGKIGDKLAERLAAGTAGAGATLGLSEVAFATLGAINGVTGAAKLFHVPSDSVDGTMRLISGIFGAIAGTTVGGVMDLLFQLVYQITGVDFLCGIATTLYTAAKKLVGKDADVEKLATAQNALNTEYDEYKNTEIEKAYQTQLKAGLIPKDTTLEQFVAGVQDGTYKAVYDSQADYIAKNHGALSDKIMQGLGKGWKSFKKAAKLQYGGFETTYTDDKGNTYQKNADGNYDIITADGENVGSITKDMIPESATKSTKFVSGFSRQLALGKQFINNLATNEKTKNTVLGKGATIVKDTAKKLSTFWDNVKEGGINFIKKNTIEDKVVYRPIDSPLSYYKYNKSKNTFTWYNQNGEVIQEDAKTYDEMMTLYGNGLVTKDASINGIKTAAVTGVKDKLKSIGSTIGNLWNRGTTAIGNALENAKKTLFGDNSSTPAEGGSGFGGRGALYSQNDPRWRNASYGSDATMGDSGCGPTAVAMAMSDATGRNINPMQMAGLAQATGDRDSTGTNWNFVGNAASMMGVPSTQVFAPSAGYIGSQLAAGNEMVLSGRTGGYGFGGRGSAYTPAGHYIVGTGIDRNGIVTYKDPTTGGYGRIPLGMLSSETGSAWSFGGRGVPNAAVYSDDGSAYTGGIMSANSPYYRGNQRVNTAPVSTGNATTATSTKNSGLIGKMTIDTSGTNSLNYRPDNAYNQTSKKGSVDWLGAVKTAKEAISNAGVGYTYGGSINITVNDKRYSVRNDCSGFVSFALVLAGLVDENKKYTSSSFTAGRWLNDLLVPNFFSKIEGFRINSINDLVPGDILCYSGHVEVFAEKLDNKLGVYNVGSDKSANNPGITKSGHSLANLKAVYRPDYAGAGVIGDASDTDATVSSSSKSSGTGASDWFDKISEAVSSFFSHTIGQFFSSNPTAWNRSMLDGYENSSDVDYDGTRTASSGTVHGGSNGSFETYDGPKVANYDQAIDTLRSFNLGQKKTNFFTKILNGALRSKMEQNVLPSLTMAQAAIESGWGESGLTQKSNNLFGIKAGKYWTGDTVTMSTGEQNSDGSRYKVNAAFRAYPNWDESIIDHGKLLQKYPATMAATNYSDAAYGLVSDPNHRYATALDYPQTIINTIEKNKLYAFDTYTGGETLGRTIDTSKTNSLNYRPKEAYGGGGYGFGKRPAIGYYGPKYNPAYGGGYGAPNNTEDLVREIVNLMYDLISVETGASGKLDALAKLKGSTNVMAIGGGSNGENAVLNINSVGNTNQNNTSRNFKQAYKIATTV